MTVPPSSERARAAQHTAPADTAQQAPRQEGQPEYHGARALTARGRSPRGATAYAAWACSRSLSKGCLKGGLDVPLSPECAPSVTPATSSEAAGLHCPFRPRPSHTGRASGGRGRAEAAARAPPSLLGHLLICT
jgi:hypothetical protein